MIEEKSIFAKLIKGSSLEKIEVVACVFTLIIIILGAADIYMNHTLYSISLIIFILLTFFIMPLQSFISNNEDSLFGLEELVIFAFHGINIIVFCITLYIIFLSDNCQLNLSYWLFILSALLLVAFFIFTKFKKKKSNKNYIKEGRGTKIANWISFIISLLLLLRNLVIPIIYTVTSEDYLNEIVNTKEILVYTIDEEKYKKKYDSEIEIKDSQLIYEIINQINRKKIKSLKGIEALNTMKRAMKSTCYELSCFREKEFSGYLYLKIYPDGYVCLEKFWFGSYGIKYYEKYYEVELLPETVEKIINIIEVNKNKQD